MRERTGSENQGGCGTTVHPIARGILRCRDRSARAMAMGALLVCGCTGTVTPPQQAGGAGAASGAVVAFGPTGLHRLSRMEYDNTLSDLLGDDTRPGFRALPEDTHDPFDNDFSSQTVSGALIASVETLATDATTRILSDATKRTALVGCTPTGADDRICLESFVRKFGQRAFRRPIDDDEVAAYLRLSAFAVEAKDFYVGIDLVLRALLQDPSFLYRVEVGTPVAGTTGLYRLGGFEIASRLSYFLLGSTPSDQLLAMAAAGQLDSVDGRRTAATELLADPRGRNRVKDFHGFWLGYHQLPLLADIATPMRAESDALVSRVVFEKKGDYFDIFRAAETFVNDALALHYGLPAPGSAIGAWVPYGSNPRRGILSHGAVLAQGAKFDDTSPTLRGEFIRSRLLCEEIPPPPPNVAVDQPPAATTSNCKIDRYAAHGSGGCAVCHSKTDPIGFGLERYDRSGAFRITDKDHPECPVSGDGEVVGIGKFNGPAALSELLIGSGSLEACVATQVYRMALGRRETAADRATIAKLTDGFKKNGRLFDQLLVDVVGDQAFIHRQVEP
jgi:hypothetical protein